MNGVSVALEAAVGRHPAAPRQGEPALQALTLGIAPGEQVAVIGPSGAGKTTFVHLLACALAPAGGRLRIDGVDPWSLPVRDLHRLRARLFLAPQTPPLPPRQRVVTSVLAARLPAMSTLGALRSLLRPIRPEQAWSALERFDLGDKLWTRVDRLSGGERQRVGLARALVSPAGLWLIDEPLSALDPTRATQAIDALTSSARERGATLVATLHQVDIAVSRFPRVLGLRDGRLAFDLPGREVDRERLAALYAQHEHELATVPPPAVESLPARAAAPPICR